MKNVQSSANMKSCHYVAPVGESPKIGMCFYCFSLLHIFILTSATKLPGQPDILHIKRSKSNIRIHLNTQSTLSIELLGVCSLSFYYPVLNNTSIQCMIFNIFNISRTVSLYILLWHKMLFHSSFSNHQPGPKPGEMLSITPSTSYVNIVLILTYCLKRMYFEAKAIQKFRSSIYYWLL